MGKSSTERVRAFRDRQRVHKPPRMPQGPPKSGAERMRALRARKKQMTALITGAVTAPTDVPTFDQDPLSVLKRPLSGAERMRLFRERKKKLKSAEGKDESDMSTSTVFINPHDILSNFQSFHEQDPDLQSELEIKSEVKLITEFNAADEISSYTDFTLHQSAHREFGKKFYDNPFGYVCDICDRLWFKNELKKVFAAYHDLLKKAFPGIDVSDFMMCSSCSLSLNKNRIPKFSKSMGFKYPEKPDHLPSLDLISEMLISPCIPFTQIRKLPHINGQYGISGQILNIPVDAKTMVSAWPASDSDVQFMPIKQEEIDETNDFIGSINKATISIWLQYLCGSPLYKFYNIGIDNTFFDHAQLDEQDQQQSLLWNDGGYLRILPGEQNISNTLLFEKHKEELSFPSIYLGEYRKFNDDLHVSPYMIAASELRRADRRGVKPYHLLYVAMKIIRLRVHDSLKFMNNNIEKNMKVIREQLQNEEYINKSLETSLVFLRCIPNSHWHWADRQQDLFSMIKQLGKPTLSLKLSANEIGWIDLLKTLYRIKNNGSEISEEMISELSYIQKSTLVNDDVVTCVIYFSKLINVLMSILQSKKANPFGEYRVLHYFQRIEFHDQGSPYAQLLLWLQNEPDDPVIVNKGDTIAMVDRLLSISSKESSGYINLQRHQHVSTCFESDKPRYRLCAAPFMPSKKTTIVTPMPRTDPDFVQYAEHFKIIKNNLEHYDYFDIESFYLANDISSDEHYYNILRAGISRPEVLLKRQLMEKWVIAFNPFILNVFKSTVDIQVILDDHSLAVHVAEYINKTSDGIKDLQSYLMEKINDDPRLPITTIIKEFSEDVLSALEITNHEAAWYLLGEPMTKTTTTIAYIPTLWPAERQRIRRIREEIEKLGLIDDVTNVWKDQWFDKYQKRPDYLEEVTLAQFVANYTLQGDKYIKQKFARVIRYRNYDLHNDLYEYKREMVTLHIPFRNEEKEILEEFKFLKIYNNNEDLIHKRRQQFESYSNPQELIKICNRLCLEEDHVDDVDPLEISISS